MTDTQKRSCPYWIAMISTCLKNDGGLFIPPDDHIARYCTEGRYPFCPRYSSDSGLVNRTAPVNRTTPQNRRASPRTRLQEWVTYSARPHTGLPPAGRTTALDNLKAKILDISCGGMRLFTFPALTRQSLVELSFGADFPISLHHTTAQVAWCNKQIDEPGYQAGITFLEKGIIAAVSRYLNQLTVT